MSDDEVQKRHAWVEWYSDKAANEPFPEPQPGERHRCPCCHCRTLPQRNTNTICAVCFWEDDGQDDVDADLVRGGANGNLSLSAARRNYVQFGACEPKFLPNVRAPLPEETDVEYQI
jgi:hypothetical protein